MPIAKCRMKGELPDFHSALGNRHSALVSAFREGIHALLDGLIDVFDGFVAMALEAGLGVIERFPCRSEIVQRPAHVGILVVIELLHRWETRRLRWIGGMNNLQRGRAKAAGYQHHQ